MEEESVPSREPPTEDEIYACRETVLFDEGGRSIQFADLYDCPHTNQGHLIIFVQKFDDVYQKRMRMLSAQIKANELLALTMPISVIVIGCDGPDQMRNCTKPVGCEFAVFTDPNGLLHRKFGMGWDVSPKSGFLRRKKKHKEFTPFGGELLLLSRRPTWVHRMQSSRDYSSADTLEDVLKAYQTPWSQCGEGYLGLEIA